MIVQDAMDTLKLLDPAAHDLLFNTYRDFVRDRVLDQERRLSLLSEQRRERHRHSQDMREVRIECAEAKKRVNDLEFLLRLTKAELFHK
jgi:hypothetical protein